jgi:hypothetical protein
MGSGGYAATHPPANPPLIVRVRNAASKTLCAYIIIYDGAEMDL